MKNYHFVNVCNKPEFKAELDALGFTYERKYVVGIANSSRWEFVRFEISEDNPQWSAIQKLLERYAIKSIIFTKFSKRDFQMAEWFALNAISFLGYPKPEDNWKEVTYDTSNYCLRCGIGAAQNAPFRIGLEKREAKNSSFFHLGWVNDEIFVRVGIKDIFDEIGLTDLSYLLPIKAGSKQPYDTIIQILVNTTLSTGLITDELQVVACRENNEEFINPPEPVNQTELDQKIVVYRRYQPDYPYCGRVKYHYPSTVQKYRREIFDKQPDFVKSSEWFGSGGLAFKQILVSRRVAEIAWLHKWRGLKLQPILLVD
jgi:hypothetical protein